MMGGEESRGPRGRKMLYPFMNYRTDPRSFIFIFFFRLDFVSSRMS